MTNTAKKVKTAQECSDSCRKRVVRPSKILLAIDPSSTRTGLAIMDYGGKLIEAAAVVPKRTDNADARILSQCHDIFSLLSIKGIENLSYIVIEGTSGKINKKRHTGQGAGMSVYGTAVGAIWMTCYWWAKNNHNCPVDIVPENEWTRKVPKKQRAINMSMLYPQYKPESDNGLDIGDAIGLARWFVDEVVFHV